MNAAGMGTVGSLDEEQQAVCRHLPQPIAAAWQEVLLARNNAQLELRLLAMSDVILRTLGVLVLCDYLRGPAVENVENLLPDLAQPQPETWFSLLNAGVDAIFRRAQPRPFALELLVWAHGPRGEPAAGQRRLEKVLALRRELLHSAGTLTIEEAGTPTERLLVAVLALCESLRWMGAYRLLRPASLTTLRGQGFRGRMQFLAGGAETAPSVDASWTAHLLLDTVYWSNPDASQLLEISPFMRVLPHARLKRSQCYLFVASPGLKRVQLRHDTTEVTVDTAIDAPDGGEWTLEQWLQKRAEHTLLLENQDLIGNLVASPELGRLTPRPRPPSRPIPDLSAASFHQPSWIGRQPSGVVTPQVRKQKQLLLIGQVVILLVIVGVGARMLGTGRPPRRDAERVVHIDEKGVASVIAKTRGGHETPAPVAPPESPSVTTARLAEQGREAALQAARREFEEGSAQAATQPVFAALKWEVAAFDGDWRGDRELARSMVHYLPVQKARCQKHALRMLAAQPGDAEMSLIASKCGVRPGQTAPEDREAWQKSLRDRLYQEGFSLINGKGLENAGKRTMARSLFADAGRLGSVRGWLGAAQVAWHGEKDAETCRNALTHAGALGGFSDVELKVLADLRGECGR